MPVTLAVIDIARPTPIRQEFIRDGHKVYMRVQGKDMPMFPGVETVPGARKAFADFFTAYAQSIVEGYRHQATVTITYPRQPQI